MTEASSQIQCQACGSANPATARWCFQCHTAFQTASIEQPAVPEAAQFAPQPVMPPPQVGPPSSLPPGVPHPGPPGPSPYPGAPALVPGAAKPDAPGATPALIFGIVSAIAWIACGLPGLLGIVGVILGISAHKKIRESHGQLGGEGKATVGIALGSIGIIIALIYMVFILPTALRDRDVASPDSISRDQKASSYPFTVRDGAFQFEVTGIDCSASRCDASMNISKISGSSSESSFFASNQKLIDTNGVKTDGYSTEGGERSIAAGTTTPIVVTFMISTGAEPRSIELHDSMFSDGVVVRLPGT